MLRTEVTLNDANCDQQPQERIRSKDESDDDNLRPQKYVRLIDRKLTRVILFNNESKLSIRTPH